MHGRGNGISSHVKRQDLEPPVLSGIFGRPTSTSTSDVTSTLPFPNPLDSPTSTRSLSTSRPLTSSPPTSSIPTLAFTIPTATPSVTETTYYADPTTFFTTTPSTTESDAPAPRSFLENKALSSAVFALIGMAALVIMVVVGTFALRRRRKNRRLQDTISFDPVFTVGNHHQGANMEQGSIEKGIIGNHGSEP